MDIVKVFGANIRRSISLENIQRIADTLEIETYKLFLEEIKGIDLMNFWLKASR